MQGKARQGKARQGMAWRAQANYDTHFHPLEGVDDRFLLIYLSQCFVGSREIGKRCPFTAAKIPHEVQAVSPKKWAAVLNR